ncbi:monocarboxylate transporter 12-like [Mytilus californianus]|uniref:monocarboxylate transporter 12-like n=1 Tax=Mytilus californianus TaxID=6549 RepID=UPI0022475DCB|nr:monocarboxylate transporter 12-like [Mytilus californianus]
MKTVPQSPDGGWGWVVVFSSLMCNILVDGIGLAYGVLLPKFADYFQASKSKVSLVGSVMIGTYMCTGPFASGLVNKFGCRMVSITGSLIAAVGVIIGSFSPNLDILIVTYGVIGGLGFGMMYLPSIVSVGLYFDKKRPIATGIAVCGSGIGTFIFSPFLEFLSEIYDWRNVLIIMAGIILNGAVCGMLIRPLQLIQKEVECSSEHIYDEVVEVIGDNERITLGEESLPFLQVAQHQSKKEQKTPKNGRITKSLDDMTQYDNNTIIAGDKIGEGSVTYNKPFRSLPNIMHSNRSILSTFLQQKTFSSKCYFLTSCITEVFTEVFDFSLLSNASFVLICIGNIFGAAAYYIPFMYLVDRALLLGIPSTEAAILLSVIGVMNIIGRILSGVLANMKKVNALVLNNIALFIAAVALFLQPLCTKYSLLVVFGVVFGLCVATYVSLAPIILCDLLGVERLANSFGLLGVARGIASVIGPLLAGMILQATGNYDASFYLGGGMFLMASILHFMIMLPCTKRLTDLHAKKETAST